METKICKQCGMELPANTEYFHKAKFGKCGVTTMCKACKNSIDRAKRIKVNVKKGYKICTKCNKELPATLEYFRKKEKGKYGLSAQCKECDKEYYGSNKKRILATQKNYAQEHKEKITAYRKEYRKNNRQKILENDRTYYLNNIEKFREYEKKNKIRIFKCRKKYRETHKDQFKFYRQNREAKKRELPYSLNKKQWVKIKQYFGNKCAYCGKEEPLAQEHFIPLSKGGEYTINNIIPSCKSCNSSKRDKNFFEWYSKYKYYSKKREKTILKYLGYKENKQQLSIL